MTPDDFPLPDLRYLALDPGWQKTAWAVCTRQGPVATGWFRPDATHREHRARAELRAVLDGPAAGVDGVVLEKVPAVLGGWGGRRKQDDRVATPETVQGQGEIRGVLLACASEAGLAVASIPPGGRKVRGWRTWWLQRGRPAPKGTRAWKLWAYRLAVQLGWRAAVGADTLGAPASPDDVQCDLAEAALLGTGAVRARLEVRRPVRQVVARGTVIYSPDTGATP